MTVRRQLLCIGFAVATFALCGCGGGSAGSGGGGDGGGHPTITRLSPSNMMVNVPLAVLMVTGSNFKGDALVAIDGQPVSTIMFDTHTLEAQLSSDFVGTVANHQITVQQSTGTSNSTSFAVYTPQQG